MTQSTLPNSHLFLRYLLSITIYPKLWLGTWTMNGSHFGSYDQRQAEETLLKAYDAGIRVFDSAYFYGKGRSDALLKRLFSLRRPDLVCLSYKGGLNWEGNSVIQDGSEQALTSSVEQGCAFFDRDYLDIFCLHHPDPEIDLRVSLDALSRLRDVGKLKFFGVCNVSEQDLSVISDYDVSVCQMKYNPVFRDNELLLKTLSDQGVFVASTSPFEQGLLVNSKYLDVGYLGKKDFRRQNRVFDRPDLLDRLRTLCSVPGYLDEAPLHVLDWIFSRNQVDAVILGCRTTSQLASILPFLDASLIARWNVFRSQLGHL